VTAACLLLAASISQVQVTIEAPDSVEAGSNFTVTLETTDPACTGLSCNPMHSTGISFQTSRSSRSFSSRTFGGTTVTEQSSILGLVYLAESPGMQWIGPFRVGLGPPGTVALPAESVFVTGGSSLPAAPAGRSVPGRRHWIDISYEPGPWLPGVPFNVNYYLNTRSFIKDVTSYWCPPRNGVATLLDAPDIVAWQVLPGDIRRTRLLTLEVTPAGAGELVLPVMQAQVTEISLPPWGGEGEESVFSDTLRLPVTPFPPGMPSDFGGITDTLSIILDARKPDVASEWTVTMTVTGPGSRGLDDPPNLTVRGPAHLLEAGGGESDSTVWWEFLVCPDDSGTVILGPDSVAWLDSSGSCYRQARCDPCTLRIEEAPVRCDSMLASTTSTRSGSLLPAALAGAAALAVGVPFLLKWRSGRRRTCSIQEAGDAEEVLTAFEAAVSRTLVGRSRPLGIDGVEEAMESAGVPQLLQRQVLRNWRDLEQLLAGRSVTLEQTESARQSSASILAELDACLKSRREAK
jgi:hypothetical protein